MILIADGGSTKADWIALDTNKEEIFRIRTLGLNPTIVAKKELKNRMINMFQLMQVKNQVTEVHFYGAGCGTPKPIEVLKSIMQEIFIHAKIHITEDILAAVYATAGSKPAIVCIIGTGSNSCYFDGEKIHMPLPSLGYTLMDEASGNYFGKRLLLDYYYNKMPKSIAKKFENLYDLDPDTIKFNLYKQSNPNMYLAGFARFMLEFKEERYIQRLIKKGYQKFFKYRVLPFKKNSETPIYFIGSIAYYFNDILEKVAKKNGLHITGVIQRPINNLLDYHRKILD